METNKRDFFFDNAKFFLIILVVFAHAFELVFDRSTSVVYRLIYLFHMPCFIFISGYFSKYQKEQKIGILFYQYIFFQTAFCLFDIFVLKNPDGAIQYTTPFFALWFTLSILLWKMVLPYLTKNKYLIIISIIFAVLVGYDDSIGYGFSVSRTIVFLPIYLFGYYFNKDYLEKIKQVNFIIPLLIFIVSATVLFLLPTFHIGLIYGSFSYVKMELNLWYAWLLRILFLGWGVVLLLSFLALIPTTKKIYSIFGKRTLQVYILHGFIIKFIASTDFIAKLDGNISKAIFLLLIIIVTFVLLTKPVEVIFMAIANPNKKIHNDKAID